MIKLFFEDIILLFVKMLFICVIECVVIFVGFVINGRKLKVKSDLMNWVVIEWDLCFSRFKLKLLVI